MHGRTHRSLVVKLCYVSVALFLPVAAAIAEILTIRLDDDGASFDTPYADAGETIQIRVPAETGFTVIFCRYPRVIPSVTSKQELQQLTLAGSDEHTLQSGATCNTARQERDIWSIQTQKGDAQLAYKVLQGKTPVRFGGVILGPRRKAVYLNYTSQPSDAEPIHLDVIGDPPVLTTEDNVFIVILNKRERELPSVFSLSADVTEGTPINPAPVRPSFGPKGARKQDGPMVDEVLAFSNRFRGESIVKYKITGWVEVLTSDKQTTTKTPAADSQGSATEKVERVKVTEAKSIEIFGGELPQIHSLYFYNVATGVVATWLRNPTFARVLSKSAEGDVPAEYITEQQHGTTSAKPVLMFSAYWKPRDIQVPWRMADLIPVPSVGFSLSSPTEDFFFGLSSEVRRNVQFVLGYHYGRINSLPSTSAVEDPTSDSSPAITKRFAGGCYAGGTFNLDFIKNIFK